MNALKTAIKKAGSQAALARLLNTSQARVWNWLHRDKEVPAEMVLLIEQQTGVSRHRLRPDLFGNRP